MIYMSSVGVISENSGIVSSETLNLARQRVANLVGNEDFDREIGKAKSVTWELLRGQTVFFADGKLITGIPAQILATLQIEEQGEYL